MIRLGRSPALFSRNGINGKRKLYMYYRKILYYDKEASEL